MNTRQPTPQQEAAALETLARMFINGGAFDLEADTPSGRMYVRVDRERPTPAYLVPKWPGQLA